VFQLLAQSIKHLIRTRFLEIYEPVLATQVPRHIERGVVSLLPGEDEHEATLRVSEKLLRDLIAQSFGLQQLDDLVGRVLRSLLREREKLDAETLDLLMTYDVDRCFVPIAEQDDTLDGIIYLGNKGYMLQRMAQMGFPVPHGFIMTTEVFRCRDVIHAYGELEQEYEERLTAQLARLERILGGRYGDPADPLLLSVRSGAAISMPGMLDSFLNVGMNEEIVEGFAARRDSPWAAWDAYRRFLQLWGMSQGMSRDVFDRLIGRAKDRHGAAKKSLLSAETMRELALTYRRAVADNGLEVPDDPWEQLRRCVELVLRSWSQPLARAYCKEMRIAKEWGTAVIVQGMVFGNLGPRSGTGVVLTRHPRRTGDDVELYGDFIMQGQGDDVVGGLVQTFPITKRQRATEAKDAILSLEADFPEIYERLLGAAEDLVIEHGMHHQEIEFTFESEHKEDLYILQSRDLVLFAESSVRSFVACDELEAARVATGIGVGGSALSGRVAYSADDVEEIRLHHPGDPVILLRPDTVPDDIHLVLQADGLLTGIGGATSHAAVAAQRLGKTCVVGCGQLRVYDDERRSELAGHRLSPGDYLSISGLDGSIYIGRHPVTTTRIHGPDDRPTVPPPREELT
jgi:pyruvate,orthophosphate dikinase